MSATPDTQRRRFLKVLGGGTIAAAGAAVVVSQTAQATAEDNADASSAKRDPASSGNYRETEHVRAFYDSLRD
ncbi:MULTISPECIES: twin-arginine translocation signal domain-containing protein [Halomonas]|uniref:twin-arginine translocation signal domain-containing protein n=1 Tax=Halomonas TaxID=2745 RepID=UPI001A8E19F1|nr:MULTISPECIES: twin-arginine translocation signal domain-containing protein [Halomonas]MED5294405.1 twin-arginine translocation signal domain-containing protein [Pseudomonadota bacterium]MBN8411291.1 twin-arginine translocation signal domain-containing protein [Halomonas litopenaei]MBY5925917.1 twin-arginine translocation signal domain-containing protein [Halomonas sp. DP4Y7-2]MBY5927649.1 twin-arginine translocation signal domain-containing protein [Halomonas sp. DP8Y7-3]MBY5985333.1 twin-a